MVRIDLLRPIILVGQSGRVYYRHTRPNGRCGGVEGIGLTHCHIVVRWGGGWSATAARLTSYAGVEAIRTFLLYRPRNIYTLSVTYIF